MLSYVYYEDVFLEKQKYNHEKDESFSIQIAKILIVFFVLFLLWNGYSHYKQIDLIRNGTPVLAEVSVIGDDKYISFTAEDGKHYEKHISGMFLAYGTYEGSTRTFKLSDIFSQESGDTTMVYYLEEPADATPLTEPVFFYMMYAISIVGIAVALWQIRRIKRGVEKNKPIVE